MDNNKLNKSCFCLGKSYNLFPVSKECIKFLKEAKHVIVGVSGGSDSMALLYYLLNLIKNNNKLEFNFKIIVAHVNHLLRGEESFRDENFVRKVCEELGLTLEVLRENIKEKSKKFKRGIEETARLIRYNFFSKLSKKYSNSLIATAHTLTDAIETMFLNLTRGSGLNGICSIPEFNGNIIRPLINLTKKDTENYCKFNKINYIYDSSNGSLKYKRNLVRHKILPVLKDINLEYEQAFKRAFMLLKEDLKCLEFLAKEQLEKSKVSNNVYNLNILKKIPNALLSRCIRTIVSNFLKESSECGNFISEYSQIKLILNYIKIGHGTITITKNTYIKILNDKLIIFKIENDYKKNEKSNFSVPVANLLTHPPDEFIIKVISLTDFKKNYDFCIFSKKILDYDLIPKDSVFRKRIAGDVVSLPFRNIKKTVKKFFNEEKVPVCRRHNLALIASGNNVLWIESFGAFGDYFVRENVTSRVLFIERRRKIYSESTG